jgi:hypothetical protein
MHNTQDIRHHEAEAAHNHRRLRAVGNGLLWLLVAAVAVAPFPWWF